jgi:hypothetical protein
MYGTFLWVVWFLTVVCCVPCLAVECCVFLLIAVAFPCADGVFGCGVFSCVVWLFECALALEVAECWWLS